jgi:hypothetical protein
MLNYVLLYCAESHLGLADEREGQVRVSISLLNTGNTGALFILCQL